jgi:hypothetical protein
MTGGPLPGGDAAHRERSHWWVPASLHIGSHTDLLQPRHAPAQPVAVQDAPLDAIIVPTNRRATHLRSAARLAAFLQCQLVAIYTNHCPANLEAALDGLQAARVTAIALPESYRHKLLSFQTERHRQGASPKHRDISRKRNIGLLIARLCGWRRILFLDDDIYDVNPLDVLAASASLEDHGVAGFKVTDYPDNSVVCHALRLSDGAQETFVGGNALLLDPNRAESFFPPIYNEDWLFLADHVQTRSVTIAGPARQLPYDPFMSPDRAFSEEFGDVFAEGLYRLFHDGATIDHADESFWRGMLYRREQLLNAIAARLTSKGSGSDIKPALFALAAAAKRLRNLLPQDFESFIRAWLIDLARWRDRIAPLPVYGSIGSATEYLNLRETIR